MLAVLTLALFALLPTQQKCIFYQSDPDSHPEKFLEPIEPFIEPTGNQACPWLSMKPACCNKLQIDKQSTRLYS